MPGNVEKSARIAVLCGGFSSEREVSLRSGKNCFDALQRLGYVNSYIVDVNRQVADRLFQKQPDVAFLALHGKYGEDGCIQGLLEVMGVPYTGNRVTASAITMDKYLTKTILQAAGLPVLSSKIVHSDGSGEFPVEEFDPEAFPVMVKPINGGSSIGMKKVNKRAKLGKALQNAADYSNTIMVEPFIMGKSITVGVFDIHGKPIVTPILELRTQTEWYDLKAKYTEGLTEFVLPAELPDKVTQAIRETTLKAHEAVGCYGLSRTDFVVSKENEFFILEINTIPGMTSLSDLPAQAKYMGIEYDELVEYILQTAVLTTP